MGLVLRHRHGPSRWGASSRVVDLRSTAVSRGFGAPAFVIRTCCPVLRGRALKARSLNLLVGTWSARAREPGL